jgi:hypothetical protein
MSKQKGNDSAFGVAAGSVFDRLMGADIARCTNEQCAVHDSCMRWIFRKDDYARVFFHGPLETHGCRLFINDGSYSPNTRDEPTLGRAEANKPKN